MKIREYSFGRITVGGRTYTSDVIIYPDIVRPSWWRRDGHALRVEDIEEVLLYRPEVVIIGTGYYGVMRVPPATIEAVKARGIEIHAQRTSDAVSLFNELSDVSKTVACLHLTC